MATTVRYEKLETDIILQTAWTNKANARDDDGTVATANHDLAATSFNNLFGNFGLELAGTATGDTGAAIIDPATHANSTLTITSVKLQAEARKTDAAGDENFGIRVRVDAVQKGETTSALTTAFQVIERDCTGDATWTYALLDDGSLDSEARTARGVGLTAYTTELDFVRMNVVWSLPITPPTTTSRPTTDGVLSGAKVNVISKTGSMSSDMVASGTDNQIHTETGLTILDYDPVGLLQADYAKPTASPLLMDSMVLQASGLKKEDIATGNTILGYNADGIARGYKYYLAGFALDRDDNAVGSAVMWLFTTPDRQPVATQVASSSGYFSFNRRSDSGDHFLRGMYDATPSHIFGTSDDDRTVQPSQFHGPPG